MDVIGTGSVGQEGSVSAGGVDPDERAPKSPRGGPFGEPRKRVLPFVLIQEGKRWRNLAAVPLARAEKGKRAGLKVASALTEAGHAERSGKLADCCTWLNFREWLLTGNIRLRAANFCNQTRLCVPCAHAAAVRTMRQYVGRTIQLLKAADWLPILVTLTVRDGPDLAERFQHLEGALQTARQRMKDQRRGWGSTEFARIQAGAWRFEVKRGKSSGLWHPHVHGLCLVKRGDFFDLPRLWAEWGEITGDSSNLDVRLTAAGKLMHQRGLTWSDVTEEQSRLLVADHCEVFKYALKFGDLRPADVVHAWEFLQGRRLSRLWGEYRGLKDEAPAGDDRDEPGPYRDVMCQWLGRSYGVVSVYDVDA